MQATVFVSYAREDSDFVRLFRQTLETQGIESRGDWLLTTGDDYASRLRELLLASDAFVFVITPDSIASEGCRNELAIAVEHRKRILPVSRRDHGDDNVLDSALRAPQWTFLRDSDDFERGIQHLVAAINTDFALMALHARLLTASENWQNNNRSRSYLLRSDALVNAERWLASTSVQPDKLPQPTPLQVEFIVASQRSRSRGARIGIAIAAIVIVTLGVATYVAILKAIDARDRRKQAEEQTAIAKSRLASIYWNNGVKSHELGRSIEAAHQFMRAGETFADLNDPSSSHTAQLASEYLAGDYELEDIIETDPMQGVVFDKDESNLLLWGSEGWKAIWNMRQKTFRMKSNQSTVRIKECAAGDAEHPFYCEVESRVAGLVTEGAAVEDGSGVWKHIPIPVGSVRSGDSGDFNRDFARVVKWSSEDGAFARVLDMRTLTPVTPPLKHEKLRGARFSHDDRVLTWGGDGHVKLWNGADGALIRQMNMGRAIAKAEFSPDESRIVAWSDLAKSTSSARLWDATTGDPIGKEMNHPWEIGRATFNHDGSLLMLSGGNDNLGTVSLWNTRTAGAVGHAISSPDSATVRNSARTRHRRRSSLQAAAKLFTTTA